MAFLGSVFDWTFDVNGPEMGFSTMALRDGVPVCGIGENEDGAGVWVTYLATDDIRRSVEAVTAGGATVFMPPMPVGDAGTMAIGMDPVGAVFGLWQSGDFGGFSTFGEVNGLSWFDHVSATPAEASEFYGTAFGRTVVTLDEAEERAVSHGGSVLFSGMEVPGGKVAGLAGAGMVVIVYEFTEQG